MTSTRRAAMRRALRDIDHIDLTPRQKALAKAVHSVPRDTTSPAAHLDPSSDAVMQTLLQFVEDCGFTNDLDLALHHNHPGPKSDVRPAALLLSWMKTNWKHRSFRRTDIGVTLGHFPKDLAEAFELVDSDKNPGNYWVPPIYSTIQNQQHRLEGTIRDGTVTIEQIGHTTLDASLRGADLDSIESVSCDTLTYEGWHLIQRFDRQAAVDKQVRDHYRKMCGRDLPMAELDMASPELIAVARELKIPLGEDGRVQRSYNDPDLRGGRKSGTPKRGERSIIGFESHKAVATRSHTYNPKTGEVTKGPKVPPYVLASRLSKANENVGPLCASLLPHVLERALNVVHVLADGGITQNWKTFNTTVMELGLQLHRTFDADHVHGGGDTTQIVVGKEKKKTHTVIVHCGEMFHINTPKHLLTPPPEYFVLDEKKPKEGETAAERKARKKRNKKRAKKRRKWIKKRRRWKYDIHARLKDGRVQFICPFCAGKLWCDEIPPSPKLRDSAKHVELPVGTTKCCNGTFIAPLRDLVRIGHQEPPYFSAAHAEVYTTRIPVEGRFGIDQERGAYAPRSCRAPRLEPHALASLIFDAIGNLQLTMNKEIEELYEIIDNYQPPTNNKPSNNRTSDNTGSAQQPGDGDAPDDGSSHNDGSVQEPGNGIAPADESADSAGSAEEPGDGAEPTDNEAARNEQTRFVGPPTAGPAPQHAINVDNGPSTDKRAAAPPRAPP